MILKERIPHEEVNFDFLLGTGVVQINKLEDLKFQYKWLIFLEL
jgi:hypothetical protein